MRRIALAALVPVAVVAAVLLAGAGGDAGGHRFTVALDNAFGLVTGSDLKVAGVRAGTITGLRLDPKSHDALVGIEVTKDGFGSLRTDAFCESRPQSLIGEYYLDCQPGTDPKKLPEGARIPVEQTGSTVPADLLADVMRRPYRERLRIILGQLGVGLAARGEELAQAVTRASPALRETDRVLKILGAQNQTLGRLVQDGDKVLGDLAGNRRDVARWVREARSTAADSAERRQQIAAGLHRLPAFLAELTPTMRELGRAADAQTPSLQDLDASAQRLEHLFTRLGPFARSSQLNLRSLADASRIGVRATRSARPVVAELNRFSTKTPELAKNLRIVLQDLDDRGRAVEKDPRSPGGQGYTGFEALLQYVYDQTLAINIYDANSYMLKANLFQNGCSEYQNAESLKEEMAKDPKFYENCASILGPSQQGVLQPDPTDTGDTATRAHRGTPRHRRSRPDRTDRPAAQRAPTGPVAPAAPGTPPTKPIVPLLDQVTQALPQIPLAGGKADPQDLLDFLLAP